MVSPRSTAAYHAIDALQGMISDGQELGLSILQWMSKSNQSWHINRALGDLTSNTLGLDQGLTEPLLSFARYDIRLERDWLKTHLAFQTTPEHIELLRDFTSAKRIDTLHHLGSVAAKMQVKEEDFPAGFVVE